MLDIIYYKAYVRELEKKVELLTLELEKADDDLYWLQCLESAGVDNWEGFDIAKDIYSGIYGDEI